MTKKHFVALANVMRDLREELRLRNSPVPFNGAGPASSRGQAEFDFTIMVQHLADFCAAQNPHFNRERWIAYIAGECGPNGGKRS